MTLGANATEQAIVFLLCLCAGLAGGIIALLFLRKALPMERAFTYFLACVGIGCVFIVAVEFIMQGKFLFYGIVAYAIGVFIPPVAVQKIKKRVKKRLKRTNNAIYCLLLPTIFHIARIVLICG